jgi:hypothetical protein
MEIEDTKDQLFRYRKANEFSLDELENEYIYFPSNKELNDPFDTSHNMLRLTKDDGEIVMLYSQLLNESTNESMRAYVKKQYENKPDELRKFIMKGTIDFISTYGIACFTVSPIHIVLWATYADNHEGICIQYDITRYSDESTPPFRAKGRHLFRSKVRQSNRPLSSLSKDDIFQS